MIAPVPLPDPTWSKQTDPETGESVIVAFFIIEGEWMASYNKGPWEPIDKDFIANTYLTSLYAGTSWPMRPYFLALLLLRKRLNELRHRSDPIW